MTADDLEERTRRGGAERAAARQRDRPRRSARAARRAGPRSRAARPSAGARAAKTSACRRQEGDCPRPRPRVWIDDPPGDLARLGALARRSCSRRLCENRVPRPPTRRPRRGSHTAVPPRSSGVAMEELVGASAGAAQAPEHGKRSRRARARDPARVRPRAAARSAASRRSTATSGVVELAEQVQVAPHVVFWNPGPRDRATRRARFLAPAQERLVEAVARTDEVEDLAAR